MTDTEVRHTVKGVTEGEKEEEDEFWLDVAKRQNRASEIPLLFNFVKLTPPPPPAYVLAHSFHMDSSSNTALVNQYYATQYDRDVADIVKNARTRIEEFEWRNRGVPKNAAIVFDVDETLLCSSPVKLTEFGRRNGRLPPRNFYPAIPAMLQLYHELMNRGYRILIVTGRTHDHASVLHANLKWAGFPKWHDLVTRTEKEKHLPASVYKTNQRAKWSQTHHIVANFGDQNSDLGPHSGIQVKLPNWMYTVV